MSGNKMTRNNDQNNGIVSGHGSTSYPQTGHGSNANRIFDEYSLLQEQESQNHMIAPQIDEEGRVSQLTRTQNLQYLGAQNDDLLGATGQNEAPGLLNDDQREMEDGDLSDEVLVVTDLLGEPATAAQTNMNTSTTRKLEAKQVSRNFTSN